jgi:hypothetical protein
LFSPPSGLLRQLCDLLFQKETALLFEEGLFIGFFDVEDELIEVLESAGEDLAVPMLVFLTF